MSEEPKRRSAHERIMELRKIFDIPEEKTSPEDDELEERARAARRKRMELAGTNEQYVAMFNRDPWTDEWLGPGPEPPDPFMLATSGASTKKEQEKEVKHWNAKSYKDWKKKYHPDIPVVHLPAEPKESKKIKKLRKKRMKREKKQNRQQQYDLAYWFLESWCTKQFRNELYMKYAGRLEELVDFCCWYASAWATEMTSEDKPALTVDDVMLSVAARKQDTAETVLDVDGLKFKRCEVAEKKRREYVADPYEDPFPDIPDEYWDEFCEWADKHPLKKYRKKAKSYGYNVVDAIGLRRIMFLKKINRRNKGFRKNLLRHDPLTGAAFVSKKKYEHHMRKQLDKFDQHRRDFVKMLDEMTAKGQISEDLAEKMMGDTKLVRQRVLKRHEEAYRRIKFNEKEIKKHNRRKQQEYEARRKWFKAHGSDINAPAFTVEIDGEEYTYEVTGKKGSKPMFIAKGPKSMQCTESVDSFLAPPRLMSTTPPTKPQGLGKDYDDIPDY
ncbi:hypothetical protein [uncultured Duncaniella sp.]|uniref:hypothetical protein n=1 Tax=uncultured Duncaniella sp. TaxID=2768039 RepID=UPI0026174894|nr:hypothetical protein [uncultured Duncaniella sp.]